MARARRSDRAAGAGRPQMPATPAAPGGRRRRRMGPIVLGAAVVAVLATKPARDQRAAVAAPGDAFATAAEARQAPGMPRLVDLGADKCIPCKAMAPILADLRTEYAGRMQVDFIDVWKDPRAGDPYRIYAIPTQIFFDAEGRELARHEGFISKQDILATWKRLGFDFSRPGGAGPRS